MKLIGMLSDVVSALFKKPATTKYPYVKTEPPERYRAKLAYTASNCTGCMQCVRDCPTRTIKIIVIDRKTKQFVMTYNIGECVYCKQCVYNCKFDALHMTNKMWESAAGSKGGFQMYYGKKEYIDRILAESNNPSSQSTVIEEKQS